MIGIVRSIERIYGKCDNRLLSDRSQSHSNRIIHVEWQLKHLFSFLNRPEFKIL